MCIGFSVTAGGRRLDQVFEQLALFSAVCNSEATLEALRTA